MLSVPWAASPAQAQYPGENGYRTAVHQVAVSAPCLGSMYHEDPTKAALISEHGGGVAFSADGRYIAAEAGAFHLPGVEERPLDERLYVWDVVECTPLRDLGPSGGSAWGGGGVSWSPDATEIAMIRDDDLVVISAATGETLRKLTNTPGIREAHPSWSPDGKVVAYDAPDGIHVVKARSKARGNAKGHDRLLIPDGSHPDFHPDGKQIAYITDVEPFGSSIAIAHARSGRHVATLPRTIWTVSEFVWSPDGQFFYFAGDVPPVVEPGGPEQGCFVVTLAGEIVERETWDNPCSWVAWQPRPTSRSAGA